MISTDLSVERAVRARKLVERIQERGRNDVMREMGSWTLSMGLSLDQGSVLGQAAAFYPTDLASTIFFIDPDDYTTLTPGTTMYASGAASPPVVTLAGTKASKGALRIEATSSTLFKWGYDNDGTTATSVQTGQTIPAGGSAFSLGSTGLSATFPAGTYATGHIYEETLATIKLKNDAAQSFTQATASKQPRLWKSLNNKYCIKWDGVDDTLLCSTVVLPNITSGMGPHWWYGGGRVDAFTGGAIFSGASVWSHYQVTATTIVMVGGGNGPVVTYAVGTAKRWIFNYTGANNADTSTWGTNAGTAANAGNTGANTGIYLGSLRNLGSTFLNGVTGAQGCWNLAPTGANLTNLEAWMSANYGASMLT